MPNKYARSGELAAVIAERDALRAEVERLSAKLDSRDGICKTLLIENERLRAENDTLRKAVALYAASDNLVIKNEAKLAKAREALQGMLSIWGLCREVTAGGPWQVITDPMTDYRCGKCESCRARQALKEIADEQAE